MSNLMDAAKNEELMHLREFQIKIVEAVRISKEKSKHPFFSGQALRRLVREALEAFDTWRANRVYQSVDSSADPVKRPL